ncbi:polyhydroxyalkanoate depolymerase, partial [Burkholderia pseudomallei]|nr:polyhydroxyalkanoate depolymerase [Burkholderia pseudomallei]
EYNAVLDMAAEYYLETIRIVFQEFRLAEGTWEVAGELVRPQDVRHTALMTIEGELDDISGSGQTHVAHELCTGIPQDQRRSLTAEKCGHYGIFSGRRWRTIIYPQLRDFIREHEPEPKNSAAKDRTGAPAVAKLAAVPAATAPAAPAKAATAKRVRTKAPAAAAPAKAAAEKRGAARAKPARARKAA